MELAAKLDEYGKPAWIATMILGFIIFWPLGLGILGYMIWSGRMGCSKKKAGRWHNERSRKDWWSKGFKAPSSGNSAFDEYRDETLRRLEEEQKEFTEFLTRLRDAKDKAEFDQFMAERRKNSDSSVPPTSSEGPAPFPAG